MNGEKVCREKGEKLKIFYNFSLKNVESIVVLVARQRGRKIWGEFLETFQKALMECWAGKLWKYSKLEILLSN